VVVVLLMVMILKLLLPEVVEDLLEVQVEMVVVSHKPMLMMLQD